MIRIPASHSRSRSDQFRRIRGRRGVTLVEMLMLMTIVAAVLAASVVQIQIVMRLDQDGRSRINESSAWERLGRQLRSDVHDASSAEPFVEKRAPGLRIQGLGGDIDRVEYRADRKEIVRVASSKGKPLLREVYPVPRTVDARFELRSESDGQFVVLVLTRTATRNREAPPSVYEILALLGKDRIRVGAQSKGGRP